MGKKKNYRFEIAKSLTVHDIISRILGYSTSKLTNESDETEKRMYVVSFLFTFLGKWQEIMAL